MERVETGAPVRADLVDAENREVMIYDAMSGMWGNLPLQNPSPGSHEAIVSAQTGSLGRITIDVFSDRTSAADERAIAMLVYSQRHPPPAPLPVAAPPSRLPKNAPETGNSVQFIKARRVTVGLGPMSQLGQTRTSPHSCRSSALPP
jgi:hypothetical protein